MCGSSPELTVQLTLLPLVPSLGLPWPFESRHLEASTQGFDVNQALSSVGPCATDEEQEDTAVAGAVVSSSPNNSAGSFPTDSCAQGGLDASDAALSASGADADRSCSRTNDEDDSGSARRKLHLSKEQSVFLEESFKEYSTHSTMRF